MAKAVFLDRDGVINRGLGGRPPHHVRELHLFPGVAQAICNFNQAGFLVFVVTNQGGVGLGYMSRHNLAAIHAHIAQIVAQAGGWISEFKACTHKPHEECSCRKPLPGMLLCLAAKHGVNLKKSYMIGDRDEDLAAGQAAKATTILIQSKTPALLKPDYTCRDLLAASCLVAQLSQAE